MKKKASKKGSVLTNPVVQAIPLTVALSLITSGVAFGATNYVEVELDSGKSARFDVTKMAEDSAYRTQVENALKRAFNYEEKLLIKDADKGWINFGDNAQDGITYTMMLEDPARFEGTPDESSTVY